MIKIGFTKDRKIISFEIDGRTVRYFDDLWKNGLQIYPMQKENVKQMLKSRSANIQAVGLLIADANQGKNYDDYISCQSEQDLVEMIRKDSLSKGLVEMK